MKVIEAIWEYRALIILAFWLITYVITSWEKFKSDIKSAMLAAKQMSKEQLLKTGIEQRLWVLEFIYKELPKTWTAILGEERTKALVQKLYDSALDLIDDGKLNDSLNK
jgi:hypothetical protein